MRLTRAYRAGELPDVGAVTPVPCSTPAAPRSETRRPRRRCFALTQAALAADDRAAAAAAAAARPPVASTSGASNKRKSADGTDRARPAAVALVRFERT